MTPHIHSTRLLRAAAALLLAAVLAAQPASAAAQGTPFFNATNSFGSDPQHQRSFSWCSSSGTFKYRLEFCGTVYFKGFSASNILVAEASSRITANDAGKRTVFSVELKDLTPGSEYIYRIVRSDGAVGPEGRFRTADSDPQPFTFLNLTDTQGTTAKDYAIWNQTLAQALGRFPDARFLIHTGDVVDKGDRIGQWDLFAQAAPQFLMNLPIEPAVGNHDVLNGNKTNAAVHNFTDTFNLPKLSGTGAAPGTAYSFDYGNAHFAVMNTECGAGNLTAEAAWLIQDMKRSDRLWKIVALHRGPYGASHDSSDIRSKWVPAFESSGVDLVLQGHDHNYLRSYPMKNGKITKSGDGILYVIANTAGVKTYAPFYRPWQAIDLQPYRPMYLAITVNGGVLTAEAWDANGLKVDSFTLKKGVAGNPIRKQ